MEGIEVDTRLKPMDALVNLFSSRSYHIERFYNRSFEKRLIEILGEAEYDIIQLESIFCAPYLDAIREHSKAKVVVRAHNIEFKIWEQLALQEGNPIKSWYLRLLSKRLKRYEISVLQQVDAIVPITPEDKQGLELLGVTKPMEVIPIGIDVSEVNAVPLKTDKLRIYHLGAMDWKPNVLAMEWFLTNVWKEISSSNHNVSLSIAGRQMPESLLTQSKGNLSVYGEVSDLNAFLSDKNVAVVPLFAGSGMRVKIVEAMAHGKVVVTTRLGATGIPFENRKNLLIADSQDEFVEILTSLSADLKRILTIGNEARKLAELEFDLKKLSSKLTYFYANL